MPTLVAAVTSTLLHLPPQILTFSLGSALRVFPKVLATVLALLSWQSPLWIIGQPPVKDSGRSHFPISDSSSPVFCMSFGPDGCLIQGNPICPVPRQTSMIQHAVVVGQVSQLPKQTNCFGTEHQVVVCLLAQKFCSGIWVFLPMSPMDARLLGWGVILGAPFWFLLTSQNFRWYGCLCSSRPF